MVIVRRLSLSRLQVWETEVTHGEAHEEARTEAYQRALV
jgi:hypothetical protein